MRTQDGDKNQPGRQMDNELVRLCVSGIVEKRACRRGTGRSRADGR